MKVIIKEPHKAAYVTDISPDLATLQGIVGGYIEIVDIGFSTDDDVIAIVNEEGKLMGLEESGISIDYGMGYSDNLVGTVIIAGLDSSDSDYDFTDLDDYDADQILEYLNGGEY